MPKFGKHEATISDDVALFDASEVLPTHSRKRYRVVPNRRIQHAIVHKSGALGRPGLDGAIGCARFAIDHRGWAGMPYSFWLAHEPDEWRGRAVILRCHAREVRSYHTGGIMNSIGYGLGVQGLFDADGDDFYSASPSRVQMRMLADLVDYLDEVEGIDPTSRQANGWALTGHWEHGKPVCPGDELKAWIRVRRGEDSTVRAAINEAIPKAGEVDTRRPSVRMKQRMLDALGFDPGPIDGIWGYRSRAALESFQLSAGIVADGVWGPITASAMLAALRAAGTAQRRRFR